MNKERVVLWHDTKCKLAVFKAQELSLRKEVAEEILEGVPLTNGSATNRESEEGVIVKATQKLNFSLDLGELAAIWAELTPEEQAVIKMKPTLQLAKYKKLPEGSILHRAVTTKLAVPTLDVVIP